MSGNFTPYMSRPKCATHYKRHALYVPCPMCVMPYTRLHAPRCTYAIKCKIQNSNFKFQNSKLKNELRKNFKVQNPKPRCPEKKVKKNQKN